MLGIRGVIFDMDGVMFSHLAFGAHVRGEQGVNKSAGLDDLLEYLRDYMVPLAAVSSRSKPIMEAALEKAGIAGSIDVLLPMNDLEDTSRCGSILLEAAELLGVRPQRTLAICSNVEMTKAAAAQGFVAALFSGDGDGEDADSADVAALTRVRELDELIDLLEAGTL